MRLFKHRILKIVQLRFKNNLLNYFVFKNDIIGEKSAYYVKHLDAI